MAQQAEPEKKTKREGMATVALLIIFVITLMPLILVPFSNLDKFMNFYQKKFDYYPLWVVPYNMKNKYAWISKEYMKNVPDSLFLDLAIYGMKQKGHENYYRMLEEELMKVNGLKTLISHNYYSEKEFWKVWNKKNYFAVKKIVDPDNIFRNVYDKMFRRS